MYDVAIIKDGPIFPPRSGASYKIYNIAKQYQKNGLRVLFILIDRGWFKDYELERSELQNIILLNTKSVYNSENITNLLRQAGVKVIQTNIPELIIKKKEEWKNFKVIFDSHDFLAEQSEQMSLDKKYIISEKFIDLTASEISDLVYCCTNRDKNLYVELGVPKDKIKVIKNGCVIPGNITLKRRKEVIFLGHLFYEPNQIALKKLYEIANLLPLVNFVCIGHYAQESLINKPKNVKFLGYVENIQERLQKSVLGIVPITQGSGSRVKILDYLSNGLYVITTNIGISGLDDLRSGCVISDDFKEYPQIIKNIFKNKYPNEIGQKLIKKYDFNRIGKYASNLIKELNKK